MVTIRITKGIAVEYEKRDVYRVVQGPGLVEVEEVTALDMLADAEWYGGPDGPDQVEPWLPGMYRTFATRLRKELLG